MQRFGTASVPTHSIGLALLRSEWQTAADLILQKRYGEHPDVEAAREAWLKDGDLDRALGLFPRRVVAERCILESFKKQKGDTRNVMGAISTVRLCQSGSSKILNICLDSEKPPFDVHSCIPVICLERYSVRASPNIWK